MQQAASECVYKVNKGFTLKAIIDAKEQKEVVEEFFTKLEKDYIIVQTGNWRYRDKGFDGELSIFVQVIPKEKMQGQ